MRSRRLPASREFQAPKRLELIPRTPPSRPARTKHKFSVFAPLVFAELVFAAARTEKAT